MRVILGEVTKNEVEEVSKALVVNKTIGEVMTIIVPAVNVMVGATTLNEVAEAILAIAGKLRDGVINTIEVVA